MLTRITHHAPRATHFGFTLAEMMLVLVLSAIVLALVSSIGTHLQRQLSDQATRVAVGEQLATGAELLPLDLRGVSPSAGDIVEARDSVLQIRATVASAVVCSASAGSVALATFFGAYRQSIALPLQAGDTLWVLADEDSVETWRPVRIAGWRRAAGVCSALDVSGSELVDLSHLWTADVPDTSAFTPGAVVRATRPQRFSFYRAGDGQWYLGLRTWNTASVQFNVVQPLSGPYAPPGSAATHFEYFDSSGMPWPLGDSSYSTIARVEALLLAAASSSGVTATDSQRVVVALRNR